MIVDDNFCKNDPNFLKYIKINTFFFKIFLILTKSRTISDFSEMK